MKNADLIEKLNSILECVTLINDKSTQIDTRLEQIDTRLEQIDTRLTKLENNSNRKQSNELNIQTYHNIEDKIDHLNKNCIPMIKNDVLTFLNNILSQDWFIQKIEQDIIFILKNTVNIYDIIAQYINDIETNENIQEKWIFVFPFQKNVLYYWNNEKQSWDKMSKNYLLKMFHLFQKNILSLYTEMVNTDDERFNDIDIIECGSHLYEDNFDKKYLDFKKKIFNVLQNG